jgi:hypothetical protein
MGWISVAKRLTVVDQNDKSVRYEVYAIQEDLKKVVVIKGGMFVPLPLGINDYMLVEMV